MAGERTRNRGELEQAILEVLWQADGPLTVRAIQGLIDDAPSYAAVITVLGRLKDKGLAARRVESARRVTFSAAGSESEHLRRAMTQALDRASDRGEVLTSFVDQLDPDDRARLRAVLGAA